MSHVTTWHLEKEGSLAALPVLCQEQKVSEGPLAWKSRFSLHRMVNSEPIISPCEE